MEKPVLSPEFKRLLAEANPVGMRCDERDVQSWFDMVWPKYSTYGYRQHKRAISNWWLNVTERDILKARERAAQIELEDTILRLEDLAEELDNEPEPDNVIDFFSRAHNG